MPSLVGQNRICVTIGMDMDTVHKSMGKGTIPVSLAW